MEKIVRWLGISVASFLLVLGIASTLVVPVLATSIEPRSTTTGDTGIMPINENENSTEPVRDIPPTFTMEVDDNNQGLSLKAGQNILIAGNNISTKDEAVSGLMLVAGNMLNLRSESEYSFVFGNVIDYSAETSRDAFLAGNMITLTSDAKLGRDVYAMGNEVKLETDVAGDFSATADTVIFKDAKIYGNTNLDASVIKFIGQVEIVGTLTYNDDAAVSGLDEVKYGKIDVFHVAEADDMALFVAATYAKIIGSASLFLAIAIICVLSPRLHSKIDREVAIDRFGMNLAIGLGVLIAVPFIALFAFLTFVAAPLGIIALLIYGIIIYLSQGFAGLWLGHLLIEKLCKAKGNIFVEAIVGILILAALSLVPYLNIATGFLGLLLGLGLMISCLFVKLKPHKADRVDAKE